MIAEFCSKKYFGKEQIIVHPLSAFFFDQQGVSHTLIDAVFDTVPVSVLSWGNYLAQNQIKKIFCTTSSPYLDMSNCNLILAAKQKNIETFGAMDHWKGIDRFFNQDSVDYMTDYLFCIDQTVKNNLIQVVDNPDRVFCIGHPNIEHVSNKKFSDQGEKTNVLIVSQPNSVDLNFQSIFSVRMGDMRIIDAILAQIFQAFEKCRKKVNIIFRPHPKEKPFIQLPDEILLDENPDWNGALKKNDIFIGLDSMAMLEAHVAGKYCISLALKGSEQLSDVSIPFIFSKKIDDISLLSQTIENFIESPQQKDSDLSRIYNGSKSKAVEILERYFKHTLSSHLK